MAGKEVEEEVEVAEVEVEVEGVADGTKEHPLSHKTVSQSLRSRSVSANNTTSSISSLLGASLSPLDAAADTALAAEMEAEAEVEAELELEAEGEEAEAEVGVGAEGSSVFHGEGVVVAASEKAGTEIWK